MMTTRQTKNLVGVVLCLTYVSNFILLCHFCFAFPPDATLCIFFLESDLGVGGEGKRGLGVRESRRSNGATSADREKVLTRQVPMSTSVDINASLIINEEMLDPRYQQALWKNIDKQGYYIYHDAKGAVDNHLDMDKKGFKEQKLKVSLACYRAKV